MKFAFYSSLISLIFHWPITYYFAVSLDMQLNGVAIAGSLNMLIKLVTIRVMINFSEYKQSLVSIFDPECYEILLYHQLIMCMHGGQMIIWGLWGAEIFSLFATFLFLFLFFFLWQNYNVCLNHSLHKLIVLHLDVNSFWITGFLIENRL